MAELEKFRALGISEGVLDALRQKGFEEPSPIQELTIPLLLKGEKDVIGQAQTGTGKTAAFGIPIIDTIRRGDGNPKALILAPTRELSIQIAEELNSLKGNSNLRIAPFYGGQFIGIQLKKLDEGIDIVIGTPGRIIDLMEREKLILDEIQFAVLDEADEMLDMGFVDDIKQILSAAPAEKRMLMFSATMPEEILAIAEQFMRPDYEIVRTKTETVSTDLTEQIYYEVRRENKLEVLSRIIDMEDDLYAMVFCKTRSDVDELTDALTARGYTVDALHGDIAQAQRTRVINNFKARKFRLLIATDVAARGIDVNDLTHVINYSIPQSVEAYVHRIGRTGRAGKRGTAITFVTPGEMRQLGRIRRMTRADIRKGALPTVEQLLEAKKERFATSARKLIDEHAHTAYLGFAEELLTLCDHPAEMLAAMLRMRFKDELLPESYAELNPRKENVNPDNDGNSRVHFSVGKDDGVFVPEILDLIFRRTGIKSFQLGRIDCNPHDTYVNATPDDAKKIVESCQGESFDVSFAKPDEGERFRGRDRKFVKRSRFYEDRGAKREFKRKREFNEREDRREFKHKRELGEHEDRREFKHEFKPRREHGEKFERRGEFHRPEKKGFRKVFKKKHN